MLYLHSWMLKSLKKKNTKILKQCLKLFCIYLVGWKSAYFSEDDAARTIKFFGFIDHKLFPSLIRCMIFIAFLQENISVNLLKKSSNNHFLQYLLTQRLGL